MHRDEREEETKKGEAGEGWRGPIPRLIESSFGTASTSLKNEGVFRNKKKAILVVHTPSRCTESSESVFVLSTEHPSVSLIGGGLQICNL